MPTFIDFIQPYWDILTPTQKVLAFVLVFIWLLTSILWFVLPFAIFGIKPLLKEQTKILQELKDHLKFQNSEN